jgi:hypothetical protein
MPTRTFDDSVTSATSDAEPSLPAVATDAALASTRSDATGVNAATPQDARQPPSASPPMYKPRKIVSVKFLSAHEMMLMVDGGAREGITEHWNARLVDANGQPKKSDLRIVGVARDNTNVRGSVNLTIDQIWSMRVILSPQDE